MSLILDLNKVDRATALRTWLTYNDITQTQLARELGVDVAQINRVASGKRPSGKIIRKMKELGIPGELLPEPGPGPGRPCRRMAAARNH